MHSSQSVLFMRLPLSESTEAAFLLGVDDVDHLHRQPCEPVNTSQRSPEGMNICHVHARARSPQAHRQRAQVAHRGMLAGRPAEHSHAAYFSGSYGQRARRAHRTEHRVLDDRPSGDAHRGTRGPANRQRDFADDPRERPAHSGDESGERSSDFFRDAEESGITCVVAHSFTSLRFRRAMISRWSFC